jgi:2-methylcitrate dehydratase PrpD
VEKAKGTLIDYLGCALAGSTWPRSKVALDLMTELGGTEESTIIGTSRKTAVDRAAFLNGMFGSSAPQLDDVMSDSYGHPGVATHPAVLAVGERAGADGKEAIVAIVSGYELAMRVGAAVGREAFERGWHPRGGCNVFAAAVAAGKLLGLNSTEDYCATLGLAGNKASGLIAAAFFHDAWYMLSGNAAQDGVVAALFAELGYDAGCTILEDSFGGYCRIVCDDPNWDRLTRGLGHDFEIMNIGQKVHSSSGGTHAAIDAALSIVMEHDIEPEDVERVTVWGSELTAKTMGRPFPDNHINATMSVPYLVAVAISDRQVSLPQFTEQKLRDPRLAELQKRTEVVLDAELDALAPACIPARVEVVTGDGHAYSKEVRSPRGMPADPLTAEELHDKFRSLAGGVLQPSAISETIEMVDDLEQLSSISQLTAVLRRVETDAD